MTTRNVTTILYRNEMLDCFGEDAETAYGVFRFYFDDGEEARRFGFKLAEVMQRAVLTSNPVLKNSERLSRAVGGIVFRDAKEKIAGDILDVFEHSASDEINLDGFVYFVLNGYSARINAILYRMVRDSLRVNP